MANDLKSFQKLYDNTEIIPTEQRRNSTFSVQLNSNINSESQLKEVRQGFNSEEFREIERSLAGSSMDGQEEEEYQQQEHTDQNEADDIFENSSRNEHKNKLDYARETIYRVTDSVLVCIIMSTIMLLDFVLFTIFLWHLLTSTPQTFTFKLIYTVIDWMAVIFFMIEVTARLFSYGYVFYFHSSLRSFEYIISMLNTIMTIAYTVTNFKWLLIFRYIRIIRPFLFALRWREKYINWRTNNELNEMINLLEDERNCKLSIWKIDSKSLTIGRRAGAGGFGIVFSGIFRGTLVAIKQLLKPEKVSSSIENEADVLVSLRHPNVLLFMGLVKEPGKLWIITEFCTRGSIRDLLDKNILFSHARILKFALGAARGLAYLHGQSPSVLHLDLKTSNILISSGWEAKLGDFGLSRTLLTCNGSDEFVGTIPYAAPEVISSNDVSTAADIYSFGICMWEMMVREIPGIGIKGMQLAHEIVENGWRPDVNRFITYQRQFSTDGPKRDASGKRMMPLSTKKIDQLPLLKEQLGSQNSNHRENFKNRQSGRNSGHDNEGTVGFAEFAPPIDRAISKQLSVKCKLNVGIEKNKTSANEMEVDNSSKRPESQSIFVNSNKQNAIRKRSFCIEEIKSELPGRLFLMATAYGRRKDRINMMKHGQLSKQLGHDQNLNPCLSYRNGLSKSKVGMRTSRSSSNFSTALSQKVADIINKFDDRVPVTNNIQNNSGNTNDSVNEYNGRNNNEITLDVEMRAAEIVKDIDLAESEEIRINNDDGVGEINEEQLREKMERHGSCVNTHADGHMNQKGTAATGGGIFVPHDYLDLMTQCWSSDVKNRPSAAELVWRLIILMDEERRARSV